MVKPTPTCTAVFLLLLILQGLVLPTRSLSGLSEPFLPSNPLAKCAPLPPIPTSPPPPPNLSLSHLLGSPETVETFFASHFQRTHFHIPHSPRPDRRRWLNLYRRFLPHNDLDSLLSRNASALSNHPLTLHTDLDLVRPSLPADHVIDTLIPSAYLKYIIDLPAVHQAFKDGFAVRVYHMHMRTKALAHLVDALHSFWMVSVTADLEMAPGSAVPRAGELRVFAEDCFFVQLEGKQNVLLYEGLFPFPAQRHFRDERVMTGIREGVSEAEEKVVELEEGGVLYVPAGCGVRLQPRGLVSLHVVVKVGVGESVIADGIIAAIRAVKKPFLDNPLDKLLVTNDGVEYLATWEDVLEGCVKIAAELVPEMRRFLPVGMKVWEVMEEVDEIGTEELAVEEVRRFARAAQEALFEPVLGVLVGEEGVDVLVKKEVVEWARSVVDDGDMGKMVEWFKLCVGVVAKREENAQNGIKELHLDLYNKDGAERAGRIEWRDHVLARHGVRMKAGSRGGNDTTDLEDME